MKDANELVYEIALMGATNFRELAAALIESDRAEVRQECAEQAVEWLYPKNGIYDCSMESAMRRQKESASLRAAITGTEKEGE